MPRQNAALYAFNRGLISPLALARTDLKRAALSAQQCENFMPRVMGSMMLRPGKQYIGSTDGNARAKFIPFIFSNTDVALVELTDSIMRVWLVSNTDGGAPYSESLVTRASVSTSIANGTFDGNLDNWTSADETGAASSWVTGNYMQLVGTGFNSAKRYQQVSVASGDENTEHAVRIVVAQETVYLRIGTTQGADDLVSQRTLGTGTHSIAFTPGQNSFYIQLQSNVNVDAWVQSVAIEAAGVMTLPTPWPLSVLSPNLLRWDQSGDVIYVACAGYQPRKIMRTQGSTNPRSWSIELYAPQDGPFLIENTGPVELTPSDTTGAITLTASEPFFYSGHVGALFRIASVGQAASESAAGTQQFTAPIQVTGVGASRAFTIDISGTWVGTVVLQRSIGAVGDWADVDGESWTDNVTTSYSDGLDNSIIFYRLGFDTTYTSGTADCSLNYGSGSITGICRITKVNSSTSADANVMTLPGNTGVLQGLGSTNATSNWWEGQWSDHQGWPTSCGFLEDRLWWAGQDAIVGSVSDAYESFDEITNTGDSGPINRNIGSGPVDTINWILGLQRMVLGTPGAEKSARSSSFDSPLTPTDFILKDAGTQGSAPIMPCKIDFNGVFIQKSGLKLFQLLYQPNFFMMDYSLKDLTNFTPDIALAENGAPLSTPGFAGIAVQRQPDTRIHGWLKDGTVRVLVFDQLEDEQCWVKVSTAPTVAGSCTVEDCVVLPGQIEDLVYYVVNRTVNGSTVRYLERWAREDECWGSTVSKCMDAHVTGANSPASTTISGLSHLIGESVVCWADGVDQGGPFTVSADGTITVPNAVSDYCVGLAYTAKFQSAKLAFASQMGTPLVQPKKVNQLGVILANTHYQGLKFGPDFNTLRSLPLIVNGKAVPANTVFTAFDQQSIAFPGEWSTDSRLCLQAQSPRPCTCLAVVIDLDTREAA